MIKNSIYIFFALLLASCTKPTPNSSIKVVGEMRDVMWKGNLKGKIATDSLNSKEIYGLGPIEFLKGEIVLFEGQSYVSKVVDSISHEVFKVPSASAPFFVYTTNSNLKVVELTPRANGTLPTTLWKRQYVYCRLHNSCQYVPFIETSIKSQKT